MVNTKLYAFDLDGTIYIGDRLVEGALDLVNSARLKCNVVFFTNNSTKTRQYICDKLNSLGINCKEDEIYTSAYATALYLKENDIRNVYVIGSDGLNKELIDTGINFLFEDNLVVGLDKDFNYDDIDFAVDILLAGGKFIACNNDGYYPIENGGRMPGCGAMVGAIFAASGRKPDYIVGKPNTYMLDKIAKQYNVKPDEIMVVGDSYESDIAMAKNYGSQYTLIEKEANKNERQ